MFNLYNQRTIMIRLLERQEEKNVEAESIISTSNIE